jgi:hypothetical protein
LGKYITRFRQLGFPTYPVCPFLVFESGGTGANDRWLLFKYGGRLRNISPMALHDDQLEAMRGEKKGVEGESIEMST